jgi:hypothetical protein
MGSSTHTHTRVVINDDDPIVFEGIFFIIIITETACGLNLTTNAAKAFLFHILMKNIK